MTENDSHQAWSLVTCLTRGAQHFLAMTTSLTTPNTHVKWDWTTSSSRCRTSGTEHRST